MIIAKLVAAMAGESNDVVIMIRSFGGVVDDITFGIANGSLIRIRRDDVAMLYSIFRIL